MTQQARPRVVNCGNLSKRFAMRRFLRSLTFLLALAGLPASQAQPAQALPQPSAEVRAAFVREAGEKYGLEAAEVERWLDEAQYQASVVATMSRPAEKVKPWKDYRPIFLGERRIRQGREFLASHRELLTKVEAATGVPAEVIVAIIGVETHYGQITGNYRALDAVYTLGFFYPVSGDPAKLEYEARRGQFFRNELAQLILLARENGLDLRTLKGSYAGAMGWGQFMPSSHRAYARDGDGDGHIDLMASLPDIVHSVANYFAAHGWQRGEPVVARAVASAAATAPAPGKLEASYTLAELGGLGFRPELAQGHDLKANLVVLEGAQGTEHWLGFPNFYVITRYNVSSMYALAVHQLSQEIALAEAASLAP